MKQLLSKKRIMKILGSAKTETEIYSALLAHSVRYRDIRKENLVSIFDIRIPSRTGTIRIYRMDTKKAPFIVSFFKHCQPSNHSIPVSAAPCIPYNPNNI